ncbi:uncharacterized protein LOC133803804 isoform X2 [Humulus lupulus]|uniref:uncharacterized protein LOC133803804 isoform X2 n=1 Tax=Humulus lupulus TaxID=3486 RepID=UPI002B41626C|nr:uncharacterized protein LOC133803804 isoform X2 [Humulus lupulus]
MPPQKRKAELKEEKFEAVEPVAKAHAPPLPRVTRSAARRAAEGSSFDAEPAKNKKAETAKKKGQAKEKEKVVFEESSFDAVPASAKKKKGEAKEKVVPEESAVSQDEDNVDNGTKKKTIVIEHCKQCNAFKTRALQVKQGLEDGVAGITVLVNPDKEMKRPFKPMKDLDMAKVIEDIVDKIK